MNEQALRDRIGVLEEEVRQLKEANAPTVAWPPSFKLRPTGKRMAARLLARAPMTVTRESLARLLLHEDLDIKNVDVQICLMRKIFTPYGVRIANAYGEGYYLDKASAVRLRQLIDQGDAS